MQYVPVLHEKEVNMDMLYVPPKIVHYDRYQSEKQHERVRTFKDFFMNKGEDCKNIFVVGEPGTGKSTFTQNIALQWSRLQLGQASREEGSPLETIPSSVSNESPNNERERIIYSRDSTAGSMESTVQNVYATEDTRDLNDESDYADGEHSLSDGYSNSWNDDSQENIDDFQDKDTLNMIDILFHVRLRDANAHCHYEDIIRDQLIVHLYDQTPALERACKLVKSLLGAPSTCVLSDGLDEWTHPSDKECSCPINMKGRTPFINPLHSVTLVTTSRPWRMVENPPADSKIEKRMDIQGTGNIGKLGGNIVNILNEQMERHEDFSTIKTYVREKNISSLLQTPILLLHIVCLFFDGREVSDSKCKIYANILDMLIGRKPISIATEGSLDDDSKRHNNCFADNLNVRRCWAIIVKISKLAFDQLFQKPGHSSVVFDSDLTTINEKEKSFALRCGILTEKMSTSLSQRISHLSFMHKTFQEFLSAIYISENEEVFERMIKSRYIPRDSDSFEVCLNDLSQVFVFMCALNKGVAEKISFLINRHLHKFVSFKCTEEELEDDDYGYFKTKRNQRHVTALVTDGCIESNRNGIRNFQPCLQYIAYRSVSSNDMVVCNRLIAVNEFRLVTLDLSGKNMARTPTICNLSLQNCKQLRILKLKDITIDEQLLIAENIISVKFTNVIFINGISVQNCTKLQRFIYSNNSKNETTLPGGLSLQDCTQLKYLECVHVNFDRQELLLPNQIQKIDLYHIGVIIRMQYISRNVLFLVLNCVNLLQLSLNHCPNLTSLLIDDDYDIQYGYSTVLPDGLQLERCTQLRNIIFKNVSIGSHAFLLPENIWSIEMRRVSIVNGIVLQHCTQLKKLTFNDVNFGDQELIVPPYFETLDFKGVDMDGIPLHHSTQLQRLHITYPTAFSRRTEEQYAMSSPGLSLQLYTDLHDLILNRVTINGHALLMPEHISSVSMDSVSIVGGLSLQHCKQLKNLTLHDVNFDDTELIVPQQIETMCLVGVKMSIFSLNHCTRLKKLHINCDDFWSNQHDDKHSIVLSVGPTLKLCTQLNDIILHKVNITDHRLMLPENISSIALRDVSVVGGVLLRHCTKLDKLILNGVNTGGQLIVPGHIETLELKGVNMSGLSLWQCRQLKSLIINDDHIGLNRHPLVFPSGISLYYCTELEHLSLGNVNIGNHDLVVPAYITDIQLDDLSCSGRLLLQHCRKLKRLALKDINIVGHELNLPENIESMRLKNVRGAFSLSQCTKLKYLSLIDMNIIGHRFLLPESIRYIYLNNVEIAGELSLHHCANLKTLELKKNTPVKAFTLVPNSITCLSLTHMMVRESSLQHCAALKSLEFSNMTVGNNMPQLPNSIEDITMDKVKLVGDICLHKFTHLTTLRLRHMTFGDSLPQLPNSITYLNMHCVDMSTRSVLCLLEFLESIPHAVRCDLMLYKVKPENDISLIKQHLESSKSLDTEIYSPSLSTDEFKNTLSFICSKRL